MPPRYDMALTHDVTTRHLSSWTPAGVTRLVWIALCLLCGLRAFLFPTSHTVYHNYANAGRCWLAGQDAYEVERDQTGAVIPHMSGYRYSPLASVLMVPFSVLPDSWGGMLWRFFNYACFLGAFAYFCKDVLPGAGNLSVRGQAALWLLLVPLSLGSMNNGQANVLLMALLLGAAAAAVKEHWNLVAALMAGACLLKIYPLAIALLLLAVYPRQLGWRFALAMGAGLLLPFALQHPTYVLNQYQNWYDVLTTDDRVSYPMNQGYRDFYLLTRFFGFAMSHGAYTVLQLGAAALVASVCLAGRLRRWPGQHLVQTLLALGCCWMAVFGPSTESSTFILIAPALAWALVDSFAAHRSAWSRYTLVTVMAMFVATFVATWFPGGRDWLYILQPLSAVLFFAERLLCCRPRPALPAAMKWAPSLQAA